MCHVQRRLIPALSCGTLGCIYPGLEEVMTVTVETIEAEALQLTAADRARLVERLISSLDIDPAVEDAWAAEVERRNAQMESGEVSLLPGPETLAELKAQFR
ncbi:MAG: addiction module protein [Gammaproteobacteria bacterium]